MNSVDFSSKQPFSMQTFGEKIQIKILGSTTPDLIIARANEGSKAVPYAMSRVIGILVQKREKIVKPI